MVAEETVSAKAQRHGMDGVVCPSAQSDWRGRCAGNEAGQGWGAAKLIRRGLEDQTNAFRPYPEALG